MLISVADLPKANCDAVLGAARESGENKGNAKITNKNGGASFVSGRVASINKVGPNYVTEQGSGEVVRRLEGEAADTETEVVSVLSLIHI